MEEEPIETIRETSRNLLVLNRRKHRDEVADLRRSMIGLRTNTDMVTVIARKLKSKSQVTASELHTLKNSLIDDAANIDVTLHTQGALRGLVREMTGHAVNKQCAAIGCFCNLALGEVKACLLIAKAAGPYLVPALDNLSAELAVTSAWTLGNLAGSGPKACELLVAQGAISKLVELLASNNEETRDSVLYALVHFAYHLRDDLKPEHLNKLLNILPSLRIAESAHLLFILSCHKDFTTNFLSEEFVLKALRYLSASIEKSFANPNVLYLFRFLANVNTQNVFRIFLNYFTYNHKEDVLQKLLETENVSESVLWFLGNAYKFYSNHDLYGILR